jgi:hypothetical protein
MKRSAILLLLVCAAALPAAALAQVEAETEFEAEAEAEAEAPRERVEMLNTKWSLDKPRRKKAANPNQALRTAKWRKRPPAKVLQTASVAGPAMPAAERVKLPRQKKKRKSQQRLPNNRTNAAKMITKVIRE